MSEERYTKGPWKAEYRGTDLIIVGATFGKPREIAKVLGYDGLSTGDARLIAAAPALLEPCKRFAGEWTHFCEHVDFARSNLDARAIRFMNEVAGEIATAIKLAEEGA